MSVEGACGSDLVSMATSTLDPSMALKEWLNIVE